MNDNDEHRQELGLHMKQIEREISLRKVTIFNFIKVLREMIGILSITIKFAYQVGMNGLTNADGQLSISQVLLSQAQQIRDLNARIIKLERNQ